jgi:hypothetical protein
MGTKHLGRKNMRVTPVIVLVVLLLVTTLGFGYLYIDANSKLSDIQTTSNKQKSQINELESALSASREAWEMINVTKSFGIGFERAHISLVCSYTSLYTQINDNGTIINGYMHQNEHVYICSPRDNMTLRVTADLHETTRSIPIVIFKGTSDDAGYSQLNSLEVKPDAFNEFTVVLPEKGWYSVSSSNAAFYPFREYDYGYVIHVEMELYDGVSFIPFVIRTLEFY